MHEDTIEEKFFTEYICNPTPGMPDSFHLFQTLSGCQYLTTDYFLKKNVSEYFLFLPFTPVQEELIMATNHPFKVNVLQTWQSSIHSSVQGWLEDLVN